MIRHCHAVWKDEWPETEGESSASEGDPLDDMASPCLGVGADSSRIVSASPSPDLWNGYLSEPVVSDKLVETPGRVLLSLILVTLTFLLLRFRMNEWVFQRLMMQYVHSL